MQRLAAVSRGRYVAGVPADTDPAAPGGLLASGLLSGNRAQHRHQQGEASTHAGAGHLEKLQNETHERRQQRTGVSEMAGTKLVSCAAAEMLHRLPLLDLSARKTTVYHKTHEVR